VKHPPGYWTRELHFRLAPAVIVVGAVAFVAFSFVFACGEVLEVPRYVEALDDLALQWDDVVDVGPFGAVVVGLFHFLAMLFG